MIERLRLQWAIIDPAARAHAGEDARLHDRDRGQASPRREVLRVRPDVDDCRVVTTHIEPPEIRPRPRERGVDLVAPGDVGGYAWDRTPNQREDQSAD